jgi:hypothetical protein
LPRSVIANSNPSGLSFALRISAPAANLPSVSISGTYLGIRDAAMGHAAEIDLTSSNSESPDKQVLGLPQAA